MKAFWVLAALVLATGCKGKETPAVTAPSTPTPTALVPESALPTDAPVLEASEIAGDFKCGSFDTKKLEMTERGLLDDRVRTRFFPGAEAAGGAESGKLEATNGSTKVFVGARELFAQGDALFERRAAKQGLFGGDYDSMKIGKLPIVAGVLKENKPGRDMVALAHGWFLDPNSDVLDVAVFVSSAAITDMAQCRHFAEKILSTVTQGPRRLSWTAKGQTKLPVSYANFEYSLPGGWTTGTSMGIHDFARVQFIKRGVFPNPHGSLEMGLDSAPGDWKSPGEETGRRKGTVLGMAVDWRLTHEGQLYGAWTISDGVTNRDHAVASLFAGSEAERDEIMRVAESIKATH